MLTGLFRSYWILFPITVVMVSSSEADLTIKYSLTSFSDPHRRPPPLRHGLISHDAQTTRGPRGPGTAVLDAGDQPAYQLVRHLSRLIRSPARIPGVRVQGGRVLEGSREPGQTAREPDVGSGGDGRDDGDDEGQHDDDDPADVDHELDQCVFFGLRDQYGPDPLLPSSHLPTAILDMTRPPRS